uniref:Uncharacterized protein n=1 Tax=Anguilla anguilla TaxID=7936 RepID=A0A0E9RCG2_ANGAN
MPTTILRMHVYVSRIFCCVNRFERLLKQS